MRNGCVEYPAKAESETTQETTTILGICLAGADELGCELEALLDPVRNVEFVRKNLPEKDLANCTSILASFFATFKPSLLLLCLPHGSPVGSVAIFEAVRVCRQEISVVAILGTAEPDDLPRFFSMGAVDFCLAPLRLKDVLPRLLRWSFSISKTNLLTRELEQSLGLQQFFGESRVFIETLRKIPKLARCDAAVLITGETGTGKEMCARAIHHLGPRSDHPFVPVNCGAIPSELVENELFGHDPGAFTGASSSVHGLVHDAEGGSLFLDEIDSLPLLTQVKLLRFLQDHEYRPLGARRTRKADIRILAASNADLEGVIHSGKFRSDLFYRLNILPLKLPALRERREDIPTLARHFVAKYAGKFSTPVKELSRSALEKMFAYEWPGNVRELENIIERAIVLSEQPLITAEDVCLPGNPSSQETISFKALKAQAIAEFETAYVRRLLADNDGNISRAARAAKKHRRAFWQLMRKHNIVAPATLRLRS
jgi:two-component system response regulator GlrR